MATRMEERFAGATAGLASEIAKAMTSLGWFSGLPANTRSYVGLIVQQGLQEFAMWLQDPAQPPVASRSIFSVAPRALVRAISLRQTVELIWVAVQVVEAAGPQLVAPADRAEFESAVLRYSRGLAFAVAEVYAGAAEERGAWDARNEAHVIDALVRGAVDDRVLAKAASLGWGRTDWVVPLACRSADASGNVPDRLRSWARQRRVSLLVGDHAGEHLVIVGGKVTIGAITDLLAECAALLSGRPIIAGPTVGELGAVRSALAESRAALRAAQTFPAGAELVHSSDLLYQRSLLGDEFARDRLVAEIYEPLRVAGRDLMATADSYLAAGFRLEDAARSLIVHANTVRYRLNRIRDVTGRDMTDPLQAREVQVALVLGADRSVQPAPERAGS